MPAPQEYNNLAKSNCVATLLDTKGPEVRSGDLQQPIDMQKGEKYVFTIEEGADGTDGRISVNYDAFIDDVNMGDVLLVDGGIISFVIESKTATDVVVVVADAGRVCFLSSERCSNAVAYVCLSPGPEVPALQQLPIRALGKADCNKPSFFIFTCLTAVWMQERLNMICFGALLPAGEMQSRRHLNVRGKSANLPALTDKDMLDLKFGIEEGVDFYALSFVKDAQVCWCSMHQVCDYNKINL